MANLLSLGVVIASMSLMYFFCLRPMRNRGHGTRIHAGTDEQDAAEVLRLQQEVAQLREQATTGTPSTSRLPEV